MLIAVMLTSSALAGGDTSEHAQHDGTELVMLEEIGCTYCREWDAVIGGIYHKTDEGKLAPLRRVDIEEDWPGDLREVRSDIYTPTFILVHDGREVGRIRGYPGEDFFWGLLGRMIRDLPDDAARPAG